MEQCINNPKLKLIGVPSNKGCIGVSLQIARSACTRTPSLHLARSRIHNNARHCWCLLLLSRQGGSQQADFPSSLLSSLLVYQVMANNPTMASSSSNSVATPSMRLHSFKSRRCFALLLPLVVLWVHFHSLPNGKMSSALQEANAECDPNMRIIERPPRLATEPVEIKNQT